MDQIGEPNQVQKLEGFTPLLWVMETTGLLLIFMMYVWITWFRGGLGWSHAPDLQFNWHPLLLTIGLVFFYGNGILIYRSQRNIHKRRLKLMHAGIFASAFFLTLLAQIAVFSFHNAKDIPNLYSLHSWTGLLTIILFVCQWIAGCVSFLYPGIQSNLRAAVLPIHAYFGTMGFITAIASCLTGLNEKAIFALGNRYSQLGGEAILINGMGLFFILFGGLTVYLISHQGYKRLPRPEDNILLTGRSD